MKKSSEIRFFKYLRINIQLIFNEKINYEKIRLANIHFICQRIIFPFDYVKKKYDTTYEHLKDHDQALKVTLNMLMIEQNYIQKSDLIEIENNLSLYNEKSKDHD